MTKTETTTESIQPYFYDDLRPEGANGNQCPTHLSAKKYDSLKPYFYDGDGLRIARTDNLAIPPKTTYYVWDDQNPTGYPQVVEEIENNQIVRRYGYGLFLENVDIWNGTSFDRFYVVRDGTNSVRMLLDSAGNVAAEYDYDAFGNILNTTINTPICSQNSYGFHSEYRDPATGFVYLRARWYEPREGRFVGMDRFNGDLSLPTTLHKYSFVFNNPINYNDPLGLFGLSDVSVTMAVMNILSYFPNVTHTQDGLVFPPLPSQFNIGDLASPKEPLEIIKENVLNSVKNKNIFSWAWKVKQKGAWDFKYNWAELKGEKAGNAHYELCADFGNFNYGVTGKALGIKGVVLHIAGGTDETFKDLLDKITKGKISGDPNQFDLHAFGDEWDDSMNIDIGINYWRTLQIKNPSLR